MAKMIYSLITSLDGYVAGENSNFDWVAPGVRRGRCRAAVPDR
jgi:hypothetical protein